MIFTSTRDNSLSITFSQAVKDCLPADGGVFVPSANAIEDLRRWIYYIDEKTSFTSVAGTLTSAFLKDEYSPIICQTIAEQAFKFSPVVRQLDDNLFNMELYHGYTGTHRDFGVSFLCSYLETTHELYGGSSVFVDFTHSEQGALMAQVLRGKKHLKAVVVYKKGTVAGLIDSDYIWNGGNILPIEMEGSEADIINAIRVVLKDTEFAEAHNLTVSNTTNVCRLMAQVFFFPYAFAQIKNKVDGDIFYALESGNYAPLVAGLYSWRFAMPVNGFYLPATASLCRDVSGNPVVLDSFVDITKRGDVNPVTPANLERLEAFFGNNGLMMRNFVFPTTISEKAREKAAKELFMKYGVFADKGTASAYATIKENAAETSYGDDGSFILVSQSHPSLSSDYCRHVIGEVPEMPETIRESIRPVQLKGNVITSSEELKQMIQQYCK